MPATPSDPGIPAAPAGAPLAITLGDAAGVGPELIAHLFAEGLPHPTVVYGDVGALRRACRALGLDGRLEIRPLDAPGAGTTQGVIGVLNRWDALPADLPWGREDARAGRGAYEYLCHAIDDALAGRVRALVTAPLHKGALHAAGIDFPGHTEILAQRSGTADYAMMLANDELRVLLVTIHIALAAVPAALSAAAELRAIRLAQRACRQAGIARPRIAVAGLNPHAGEGGAFGDEEARHIAPALAAARAEGLDATGPWPGDTVFMRARRGEFDIVVAQYHDQGLIPVKYLGLDEGVNVTVGLPFVRTSVDHGTAFDIAGRGLADPASLRAAVRMALKMTAANPG
ncbi:4-hydroxythreonine-4-phosphate dehydrogenase PdxA [Castellaniella defragrans]|uniref:4-hydroxythreonine-4-phosphate dehydrogenase n=1 Tax=Castellaniella defragrans TaxID=75697 RepID=A0A7W9TQQ8_CASDE|nr:4-hydroxythreonine-4-phosphate dehydrogenase PdxA [Castellaniella defragrans]KAB0618521.1 4-hydroxythreonine-4-phosphate dehydrogenase PdxA [Castellaniella defragrans]MBB6085110.1 4-hydroxythreonine-4-phosphate dehydrogenase [Castellaniella defragrans]